MKLVTLYTNLTLYHLTKQYFNSQYQEGREI